MSPSLPSARAAPIGRSVIILDGVHRGEVGQVVAAGGGLTWVKIAGVEELLGLADSSTEASWIGRKIADAPGP